MARTREPTVLLSRWRWSRGIRQPEQFMTASSYSVWLHPTSSGNWATVWCHRLLLSALAGPSDSRGYRPDLDAILVARSMIVREFNVNRIPVTKRPKAHGRRDCGGPRAPGDARCKWAPFGRWPGFRRRWRERSSRDLADPVKPDLFLVQAGQRGGTPVWTKRSPPERRRRRRRCPRRDRAIVGRPAVLRRRRYFCARSPRLMVSGSFRCLVLLGGP